MTPQLLAQTAAGRSTGDVLLWVGAFIAAVLAMVVLWQWIRRRLAQPSEPDALPLTLGDIDRLHRRGKLSADEHRALRQSILERSGLLPDSPEMSAARAQAQALKRRPPKAGLTAAPGYDLTGEPLPSPEPPPPPPPTTQDPERPGPDPETRR